MVLGVAERGNVKWQSTEQTVRAVSVGGKTDAERDGIPRAEIPARESLSTRMSPAQDPGRSQGEAEKGN